MTPSVSPADVSNDAPQIMQLLAWGLLASMGGAVKFISLALRNKDQLGIRRFLVLLSANVFVSGFSGLMGALALSKFTGDHTVHLVGAGVFGYGGPQILDILVLSMQRKVSDVQVPLSSIIPIPPSLDPVQK